MLGGCDVLLETGLNEISARGSLPRPVARSRTSALSYPHILASTDAPFASPELFHALTSPNLAFPIFFSSSFPFLLFFHPVPSSFPPL